MTHEEIMKLQISNIEAAIGEYLSHGFEPTIILIRPTECNILLDYLKVETDYKDWEEGVYIGFGGDIKLKIIRTNDIKSGEIYVR